MSLELIKKEIPFTADDLETNRRGQISRAQLQRLKDEVGGSFQYGVIGILLSVVLFIIVAIVFSPGEYKKTVLQNLPPWFWGFSSLGAIIFIAGVFLMLLSALRSRAYAGSLEVKMAEGKTERFLPGVDEYAYRLIVGEVEFYVDEKTHDAFDGDFYRVYFLDSSDILSVEEIGPFL